MLWKAYRPVLISWCLCGAKVQEKEGSLALFTASELGGEFFTMVRLNDSKEHPLGFLNFGVLCLSSPPQSLGPLGIGPILAEALRGRPCSGSGHVAKGRTLPRSSCSSPCSHPVWPRLCSGPLCPRVQYLPLVCYACVHMHSGRGVL